MSKLESRLRSLEEQFGDTAKSEIQELAGYLEGSQYLLIELMVHNKIWSGPVPLKPNDDGAVEFGLVPYWVHNPPGFVGQYFAKHPKLKFLLDLLADVLLPCHIDKTNYNTLLKHAETVKGIVADDGTIYGNGTYEQLDEKWLYAFLNYLIVHYLNDRASFVNNPAPPIAMQGASPGRVRIGIIGDWGTGKWTDGKQPQCPSQQVMAQLLALKPDYIVHLGDVYYAGTANEFQPPKEEMQNLLDVWPSGTAFPAGRSFTLNSNHEMYSGARGYYQALADARFAAQQKTSFFALQYAGWTILGLDSGYFSKAPLYMQGSIGGTVGAQGVWIRSLRPDPAKTIVMTHHNALKTDGSDIVATRGSPQGSLWAEVCAALGGPPAYWYWGHIHNGIAYSTPICNGSAIRCRCIGHSAIPFGQAWGIGKAYVDWFADGLNRSIDNGVRVDNGFALIDISSAGHISESVWAQGNTHAPVWVPRNGSPYPW